MKVINAIGFALFLSGSVFAGQGSGGGGPSIALIGQDSGGGGPKAIGNGSFVITDLSIPSLGLSPVRTSIDDYRRAAARLSVETQRSTTLRAEGLLREVKAMDGGIVDLDETSQFLPDVN